MLAEPGTLFAETLKAMSTLQPVRMLYDEHGRIITRGADGSQPTELVIG
jgi:hypothetical protein